MEQRFIQRIELGGFRGLYGRIEFEKGLTLLVGPNCSGKTAVIEAIAYLVSVSYSNLRETHGYLMLLHAARGSLQHSLVSMVGDESEGARVSGVISGEESIVTFSRKQSYEAIGTMIKPVVELSAESSRRRCRILYRLEPGGLGFSFTGPCMEGETSLAVVTPGVYPYNMFDEIVGMAKRSSGSLWTVLSEGIIVDGKRYTIDIASDEWGSLATYVREDGGPLVSFYSVGRGLQRALIITAALEYADIVLIDEIESAMHPELLAEVARRVANAALRGKQVIITTQSLEAARFLAAALLNLPSKAWRRPEELIQALDKAEPKSLEALSVVVIDRDGQVLRAVTLRGPDAFDEIIRGEDVRMLYTLMVDEHG